jgi:hypothetical protein
MHTIRWFLSVYAKQYQERNSEYVTGMTLDRILRKLLGCRLAERTPKAIVTHVYTQSGLSKPAALNMMNVMMVTMIMLLLAGFQAPI